MIYHLLSLFLLFCFVQSDDQINNRIGVNQTMYLEIQKMEAQLTYGTFALIGILILIILIIRFRDQRNA